MKLLLILFAALAVTVNAASHYINASATGTTTGASWANAWTNLTNIVFTRGDTYYIASGNYNSDVLWNKAASGSTWIYIRKANAADNSGDAGWDPSFATGQAVLDGRLTIATPYWDIDGITGSRNSGHGILIRDLAGQGIGTLLLENIANGLKLKHLEIRNSVYNAPTGIDCVWDNGLGGVKTNWYIGYCYIHECSKDAVSINSINGGTSFSDYSLLFENNWVSEDGGALNGDHGQGFKIQGDSGWVIMRNNVFNNNSGTAVIAFLGNSGVFTNFLFYNNVFYKDRIADFPTISPAVIYGRNTVICSNFTIANNTIWGMGDTNNVNTVSQMSLSGSTANALINNAFEHCYFTSGGHLGFSTNSNNGYYNAQGSAVAAVESGQVVGTSSGFNNAPSDLSLFLGSYLVRSGQDVSSLFTTDINGTTRSVWDIGAFAFTAYPTAQFNGSASFGGTASFK